MKQYVGTKTVKAEPMTMGEAYDRRLLKKGVRPSECETDKAGYFIEYDSCQLWLSANVFERIFRVIETPLDRMRIEYDELNGRYQKSKEFIDNSQKYPSLDYLARVLLSAQNETQREYCFLLSDRINEISGKETLLGELDFGTAIKLLKAGGAVCRADWRKDEKFVIKQVPAQITEDVIPNMQSLPQIAKDILMSRKEPHIDYTNQMLIINSDGHADSWLPSAEDIFARDWMLVTNIHY